MNPESVREKLVQAIRTMRDTCDEADSLMRPGRYGDEELLSLAARVHHAFVWGWANASTDIEAAIARVERMNQVAKAQKPDGSLPLGPLPPGVVPGIVMTKSVSGRPLGD